MSFNVSEYPSVSWDYSSGRTISSETSESLRLTGHLSIPEYIGEVYEGAYEVTPSGSFQLLPTADRVLTDDILVHPIPYSEVSNAQGGLTVTIGE